MRVTIERSWDDNEETREGHTGRIYTLRSGRPVWLVLVDGVTDSDHRTARAARERAETLRVQPGIVQPPIAELAHVRDLELVLPPFDLPRADPHDFELVPEAGIGQTDRLPFDKETE